jgi:hypothetical protein
MAAGDKGIEAFETMHKPELHQLVERAVDLERRAKAVIAQLVENGVGAQGPVGIRQRPMTSDWFLVRSTGACT